MESLKKLYITNTIRRVQSNRHKSKRNNKSFVEKFGLAKNASYTT